MNNYLKVYEQNKKLDSMYVDLYGDSEEIFNKNILEFLVELGEFANETKCFKYWSKKAMGAKEDVLEEFADCITMCLYFCNLLNIDLNEIEFKEKSEDIISHFIYLYKEVSLLKEKFNKDVVINIFINLRNLGLSFGFSDEEITESCVKKIKKNIDRINSKTY